MANNNNGTNNVNHNNNPKQVAIRRSKTCTDYSIGPYGENSMWLVKNLAVLIEFADILLEKLPNHIFKDPVYPSYLQTAIDRATSKIGSSEEEGTEVDAITKGTVKDAITRFIGVEDLNDYIVLLKISLAKALADKTGYSIPAGVGLFDKLKDQADPSVKNILAVDIQRITDMYIPV